MRQEEFNEKLWNEYEELKRRVKRILKRVIIFIILSGVIITLSMIGTLLIHNYIY